MKPRIVTIETPEKILFHYELAGMGARVAAWLVDFSIQALIFIAALFPVIAVAVASDNADETKIDAVQGFTVACWLILLFLLKWGYFVLFESLMKGQTPGKRAFGMKVVRANGEPLDFESIVVRNLVRAVDDIALVPLLGFFVALAQKQHRRLGDLAAGTIVVRKENLPLAMPRAISESELEEAARAGEALAALKAVSSALGSVEAARIAVAQSAVAAASAGPSATGFEAGAASAYARDDVLSIKRYLGEAELMAVRRFIQERERMPQSLAASTAARLAKQAEARTGLPLANREPFEYLVSLYHLHARHARDEGDSPGDIA